MPCDPVHPNFFARRPQLTPQEIVSIQRLTRFSMKDEFVWLNAVRAKPCKSLARLATERDEPHTSLRFRRELVKPRATPFCFAPACAKQVTRSRRADPFRGPMKSQQMSRRTLRRSLYRRSVGMLDSAAAAPGHFPEPVGPPL